MGHDRQQVRPGGLGLAFVVEFLEAGGHFKDMPFAFCIERGIGADVDLGAPVRPGRQLAALFPGEIEQGGDHRRGERDRDRMDPVKRLAFRQAVQDVGRALADRGCQLGDGRRGHGGGNGAALFCVLGVIHGDEHPKLHAGVLHVENDNAAMFPG